MTKKIKKTGRVLPRFCLLCVWKFRLFKKSKRMWTEGRHSKTYVIHAEIDHNKPTQAGISGTNPQYSWSFQATRHSAQCWMSRVTKKPWKVLEIHKTKSKKKIYEGKWIYEAGISISWGQYLQWRCKNAFLKKRTKMHFYKMSKGCEVFSSFGKQASKLINKNRIGVTFWGKSCTIELKKQFSPYPISILVGRVVQ